MKFWLKWFPLLIILFSGVNPIFAQEQIRLANIPRVSHPPKIGDFLNNTPREAELKITDFRQFDPSDGAPVSQPTTAYLSYDDKNLYVAFICIDDPSKIRAQIGRRDSIFSDDRVDISLDTFHDHRRDYWFESNPYGVQLDGVNIDGIDDINFDTLWYSEGKITKDGYTVFMTIPFKSLRFANTPAQTWGILLARSIQRNSEWANWPYVTRRLMPSWEGQFGDLQGLENISPGRNLQFIPYGIFSRARYLKPDGSGTNYSTENDGRAGLDAKMILRDSLTLDMTFNPDFSQVESDSPQVTINQRYEVYFPEKRPFFLENSDYFQTPENLFFSRRMADPQIGLRITGKLGLWGVAALTGDDRAPGKLVPEGEDLHDDRAAIGVFRLYRELGKESRAGMLITSRDFGSSSNRVLSFDTRLKLKNNITLTGQWMGSETHRLDGSRVDGTAGLVRFSKAGQHFNMNTYYQERSPGFETDLGYITRVDIREAGHDMSYAWRPAKSCILNYGPSISSSFIYDHSGTLTDWQVNPSFSFALARYTMFSFGHTESFERFEGIDFRKSSNNIHFGSEWQKWLHFTADLMHGDRINYYPAYGLKPFRAKSTEASFSFTIMPASQLRLDETYLYTQLAADQAASTSIFNNHILRTKANYQFTREFSLRAIVDYNAVLPNSSLVNLERTKQLGLDILFTYMVHPGTALHIGYTDNYENLRLDPAVSPLLQRTSFPDTSVGRQIFMKLSYMFRM